MFNYFQLGASLYTPATHHNLMGSLSNGIVNAQSIVVCTEDAVGDHELESALLNLENALDKFEPIKTEVIRLVRPRNPEVFDRILKMNGIEKIDGFVLPKATPESLIKYRQALKANRCAKRFGLMPTLETKDALNPQGLQAIRHTLDSFKDDIVCLRIGGNDIMNILGIKRMPGLTIYETPVRNIIDNIVVEFRTNNYEVSAPVFDYIDDRKTLERELAQDINYGFFAKTAIHPDQIPVINESYCSYLKTNGGIAKGVISEKNKAVYKEDGQMMEVTCHRNWASRTAKFAESMKLIGVMPGSDLVANA